MAVAKWRKCWDIFLGSQREMILFRNLEVKEREKITKCC